MLSVEDALTSILSGITPLTSTSLPLAETRGLVLAQDVIAHETIPPFANSAMDGFALRSRDSKIVNGQSPRIQVIGSIAAGSMPTVEVTAGTAMRIMTGAPIPPGADTVIQIELTQPVESQQDQIELFQEVPAGNNIRPAGEDMQPGQLVLSHGTTIDSWEIGLLGTLGWATVPVIRRARVAILSTGDEIIEIDQPLQPGKIRNSNGYMLASAIRSTGAEAHQLGIARDTTESLQEMLSKAAHYDLILTSGGVSVGDFDLVKQMIREQGEIDFWRINIKPGKPVAFGTLNGVPLLGLPGNPVSSAITFELFGRPLLRKLQGHSSLYKPQVEVIVTDGIKERSQRRQYIRARVEQRDGRFIATTTGNQGSNLLTSLRNANALLVVPENSLEIPPGGTLQAIMLHWSED